MDPAPYLDRILDDEGITSGLDESESAMMIRALSDHVRRIAAATNDPAAAKRAVEQLCKKARQITDELSKSPVDRDRVAQLKRQLANLTR